MTDAMKSELPRKAGLATALALACGTMFAGPAMANHSVLVEGAADFDGDGLIGTDEDTDGDGVFGTLQAAVNGVGNNGRVTVVTSGTFLEQVLITTNAPPAGGGVLVLEAAPGVNANIEAFESGGLNPDGAAGNGVRQNQPGIVINSDGTFPVELRNLVIRNWTAGIVVNGGANVTIDKVTMDSNTVAGVVVNDDSSVAIVNSNVTGSGKRRSGSEGVTLAEGVGIQFNDSATGAVSNTTVAHNGGPGIEVTSRNRRGVNLQNNTLLNNNPDTVNVNSRRR